MCGDTLSEVRSSSTDLESDWVLLLRLESALRDPWFELGSREPEGLGIGVLMHVPYSLDQIGYSKAFFLGRLVAPVGRSSAVTAAFWRRAHAPN